MAELSNIIESAVARQGAAIMGIVNTTPDSFFDGGKYLTTEEAVARVDGVIAAGASIVDVGGESTKPGAAQIPAPEQIRRVEQAVRHAVARGALVSIDTTDPEVAEFALGLGAHIVNDVSCLANDDLARVTARAGATIVITHARGTMSQMRGFSEWPDQDYGDVVEDVLTEWKAARDRACAAGVRTENVWLDPGLGFSKNARHTIELLRRTRELRRAETRLVVGPGRKSFIAAIDPAPAADRLGGTIAASLIAAERGADVLRVHDVREVRQALAVHRAVTMKPTEAVDGR